MGIPELGLKPVMISSRGALGHPQRTPYLTPILLCLARVALAPTSCHMGHSHHSALSMAVFRQ